MTKKLQTPSQTVGPYFAYGLSPEQYGYDYPGWVNGDMVEDPLGEDVITICGQVFDGDRSGNTGCPIRDLAVR